MSQKSFLGSLDTPLFTWPYSMHFTLCMIADLCAHRKESDQFMLTGKNLTAIMESGQLVPLVSSRWEKSSKSNIIPISSPSQTRYFLIAILFQNWINPLAIDSELLNEITTLPGHINIFACNLWVQETLKHLSCCQSNQMYVLWAHSSVNSSCQVSDEISNGGPISLAIVDIFLRLSVA